MKLGRLFLALVLLTCLIPGYFFGASYLLHEHRFNLPLQPHPFLALWLVVAVFLYWKWAYQSVSWGELLRVVLYAGLLAAAVFIGVSVSFWAVVSVYGL